ncbi:MAG TPA: hypothetical protein VL981_05250 [Candidatus Methylacidiphilales bacterium]|nr:hypothetical protein [Candidatus Methylacidiphilales bacterium]
MTSFEFDEIGYWSEIKFDIIRDYAKAYSTILAKQKWCKKWSEMPSKLGEHSFTTLSFASAA